MKETLIAIVAGLVLTGCQSFQLKVEQKVQAFDEKAEQFFAKDNL